MVDKLSRPTQVRDHLADEVHHPACEVVVLGMVKDAVFHARESAIDVDLNSHDCLLVEVEPYHTGAESATQ